MSVGDSTQLTRISAVPPAVIFLLALLLLSLAFRRHLSLPLGASQFDAGDTLLCRLAATDVGGDQILAEEAALLAHSSVSSFPSRGNHHCLPYHSNPISPGPSRQRTVHRLRVVHLCLAAALRQVFAGYEHPPGFIIGSASAGLHIRGQKIRNTEMHFSRDQLIGSASIAFGITLFVCFFYVAIVSKLLPPYENRFLAAIQNDWYYCLLVPLTLPVIIVAVYLHWLSMKMFKHA